MSALVMVQALFKKTWLPVKNLPLAKETRLSVVESRKTDIDIKQSPGAAIEQISSQLEKTAVSSVVQHPLKPKSFVSSEFPDQVSPILDIHPTQQVAKNIAKPSLKISSVLTVPAPAQFHVAATMINEHWGIVVRLPQRHAGLQGQDYLMLSKLISAFQQLCGQAPSPVEFDFFHWPPKRGIASALNDENFSLSALKGFLHKKALRKQCSWVVLDESFARFCFQKPDLDAFQVIPRGQHVLLASPSISKLQSNPEMKKELWGKLQVLAIQKKSL